MDSNETCRKKCAGCRVRYSAVCGIVSKDAGDAIAERAMIWRVREGQRLDAQALRTSRFQIITSGVVKLLKAERDGRTQIVGLKFPGEQFDVSAREQKFIVEAATPLTFCSIPHASFSELTQSYPEIERVILSRCLDELDRIRDWIFVLGRNTAEERVACLLSYLLTSAGPASGGALKASEEILLPLSRSEMAECLGLRLETISRRLRKLEDSGVIAIRRARYIRVLDRAALSNLAAHEAPALA